VWKNLACSSRQLAASASHRFQFHKPAELFVGAYDEALSVAALRIRTKDRSPVAIQC
jgi:hypothetical protein